MPMILNRFLSWQRTVRGAAGATSQHHKSVCASITRTLHRLGMSGRVADECLQLHGGAGYMDEYRISRLYTDARVMRIFAGTSEIMKEIIGRSLGLDERKAK